MGNSAEYFARMLGEQFPEFRGAYEKHLESYEEFLGHIFFGETLLSILLPLLKTNRDRERIRQYIYYIENMYANGDDYVQNIVGVTIVENFGDDEIVLRNAFSYFSEGLMLASRSIENGRRRRDIRIWHKNGEVLYDWKWPK